MKNQSVIEKRQQYDALKVQLDLERSSFISQWTELGENQAPRAPRFTVTDVNQGDKRFNKLMDNTPIMAMRTAKAGFMSGITSPARPWFNLATPDPEKAEMPNVKSWTGTVTRRMLTVFSGSNLYNVLPIIYESLLSFATGALLVEEDAEEVIRCFPLPIGSYSIAIDHRLRVNTFTREFTMTADQIVRKFGMNPATGSTSWENISESVKSAYETNKQARFQVCQIIAPNPNYNPQSSFGKHKLYVSSYYEKGETEKLLREAGYDYFPVLCPRWQTTGEDAWGTTCPGMESLGDCKALQLMQKRLMESIDKFVRPPMKGPSALKNTKASIVPGDITYDDTADAAGGFRPVMEIQPRVQELMIAIQDHQRRINTAFFVDLFLMLANSDRRQITAREVEERHEEKLLALGPVLEQLNQDLLNPLIKLTFQFMQDRGMIPPPPEELQGMEVEIEYISIMAQAQKLVGIGGVERMVQFVSGLGQVWPEALDKLDAKQTVDIMADFLSVPSGMIRSDESVGEIQAEQQQAAAMQAQGANAMNAARAMKDLSAAKMQDGQSALDAAMNGVAQA